MSDALNTLAFSKLESEAKGSAFEQRLRQCSLPSSSSFLKVTPSSTRTSLSPFDFRLACYTRLALSFPQVPLGITCECGKAVEWSHHLTCELRRQSGSMRRHNVVAETLAYIFRRIGSAVHIEPYEEQKVFHSRLDLEATLLR